MINFEENSVMPALLRSRSNREGVRLMFVILLTIGEEMEVWLMGL